MINSLTNLCDSKAQAEGLRASIREITINIIKLLTSFDGGDILELGRIAFGTAVSKTLSKTEGRQIRVPGKLTVKYT